MSALSLPAAHPAGPPVTVRDAAFDAIAALHGRIPEFAAARETAGTTEDAAWFAARVAGRDPLALIAARDGRDAGYMVSYDKYNDGSCYCWMAGVDPDCRRGGVLAALMDRTAAVARARGYDALRIRTRNGRRDMLRWLVARGFDILSVDPRTPRSDSRIALILPLGGGAPDANGGAEGAPDQKRATP